jgi:carbonic anhydrase
MFLTLYLTTFILFIGTELISAGGTSWSYDNGHGNGPANWKNSFPQCGGSKQSPIDIKPESAKQENMGDITFQGYNTSAGYSYKVNNNGHTVQLSVTSGEMMISGGQLSGESYKLAQFHVHWGSSNDVGSEHTVNGKFYPLEIHLVHYDTKYANIKEAINHSDGLAVLGIFAEVGNTPNEALQNFIVSFDRVTNADTSTNITAFPLRGLLPSKTNEFTRYEGSLTTPECLEIVTWTVFKTTISITQTQLNAFRTLNHNAGGLDQVLLVNNYRPVQPINSRIVKRSYNYEPDSVMTTANSNAHHHSTTTTFLFGSALVSAVYSAFNRM